MERKVRYSKRTYYVNVLCFCHCVDAVQDGFGTADGKVKVVDHWGLVVSMSTPRALRGFAGRVERHRLTMPMAVSKPKRIPLKTNLDPKIPWHTTRADLAVAPLGIWWHLHIGHFARILLHSCIVAASCSAESRIAGLWGAVWRSGTWFTDAFQFRTAIFIHARSCL